MLVAATGYTDTFWRPSEWHQNILVDLQPQGPQPGLAKMEKMEKFLVRIEKYFVRMEKFPGKMEKTIVCAWQNWGCYLKAVPRGLSSGHKERALCCLFHSEL
jgi:hypothetical protein